jgi:hypothetical protein
MAASLREQVEQLLPGWESWYPSLFDAAQDLGLIRAQVCSPDSLLLSNSHAAVRQSAENLHRERWGGTDDGSAGRAGKQRRRQRPRRRQIGARTAPDQGLDSLPDSSSEPGPDLDA